MSTTSASYNFFSANLAKPKVVFFDHLASQQFIQDFNARRTKNDAT